MLYEINGILEELDASDTPLKQYVYGEGLDQPIAFATYQNNQFSQVYYYHCNAQSSVGALTNSNQEIEYYVEYDSFGEARFLDAAKQEIPEEPLGNPYLWQSRRLDTETSFYYYRNRYYDSVRGRFISADPMGNWHDGYNYGNRYTFVGNRPWDFRDPMGLAADKAKDISVTTAILLMDLCETTTCCTGLEVTALAAASAAYWSAMTGCGLIPFPGSLACAAIATGAYAYSLDQIGDAAEACKKRTKGKKECK